MLVSRSKKDVLHFLVFVNSNSFTLNDNVYVVFWLLDFQKIDNISDWDHAWQSGITYSSLIYYLGILLDP